MSNSFTSQPAWAHGITPPIAKCNPVNMVCEAGAHKQTLNSQQFEALAPLTGRVLVNSAAGTGKSTVLVARMLAIQESYPDARILMLTFSKKAAMELRDRIGDSRNCQVSTFHSICFRLLRQNGYSDFTVDTNEATRLSAITKAIGKADTTPDMVLRSLNRRTGIDKITLAVKSKYFKLLRQNHVMTFDAMQPWALELLETHQNVLHRLQQNWDFILIDEYQDTDEVQQRLVELMTAQNGNVCAVGDVRQSIYGFRGAVPDVMKTFASNAEVRELSMNYRSTAPIIGLANRIMSKETPLIVARQDDIAVYPAYLTARDEREEAEAIASSIEKLHKKGTAYKDMAVLYRSSSLAPNVVQTLLEKKIPVISKSHMQPKMFQRPYIGVLNLCRYALAPDDVKFFQAIMPTLYLRRSQLAAVRKIHDQEGVSWITAVLKMPLPFFHLEYVSSIQSTLANIIKMTAADAVKTLLRGGYGKYIGKEYAALVEVWGDELKDIPSLPALLAKADELKEQIALMKSLTAKSDGDAVQMMTIHASKGLEFRAVFLIGAYDGALPSNRDDADAEEERRLLYVAVTRAKERLYISYPIHTDNNTEDNHVCRFLREAFSV